MSRFLGGATVSLICRTLASIFTVIIRKIPRLFYLSTTRKKKRPTFGTIQPCQCLLSEKDVFKISLFVQDKTDTNLFILHSFFKPYHLITYLKFNIRSSTCQTDLCKFPVGVPVGVGGRGLRVVVTLISGLNGAKPLPFRRHIPIWLI